MLAAEAYGRLTFGQGREFHTDLLGGYSYFHIGNDLSVDSNTLATLPSTGGSSTFVIVSISITTSMVVNWALRRFSVADAGPRGL